MGIEISDRTKSKLYFGLGCLISPFAFAFLVSVLFGISSATNRSPEQRAAMEAAEERKAFYYSARAKVESHLKSPSTAEFSNYITDRNTGAVHRGDGLWEAFGWVEAQNSFGAKLRQNWVLVAGVDKTRMLYLRIGDQTLGAMRTYPKEGAATPTP